HRQVVVAGDPRGVGRAAEDQDLPRLGVPHRGDRRERAGQGAAAPPAHRHLIMLGLHQRVAPPGASEMNDIDLTSHEIAASAERSVPSSEIELWETLRAEAGRIAAREEQLRAFLDAAVQRQVSFGAALARLLARKLADMSMSADR